MSLLSLILPEIGLPDKTQDPKIVTAFSTIQTWANGEIGTANLENESVTEPKIATGAVSAAKIGTGAVTESKIGANAVSDAKIIGGKALAATGNSYSARAEFTLGAEHEVIGTRSAFVVTDVECKAHGFVTYFVGGKEIAEIYAEGSPQRLSVSFWVPVGQKWEARVTTGSAEKLNASYLVL
jgi:hypothetical protein